MLWSIMWKEHLQEAVFSPVASKLSYAQLATADAVMKNCFSETKLTSVYTTLNTIINRIKTCFGLKHASYFSSSQSLKGKVGKHPPCLGAGAPHHKPLSSLHLAYQSLHMGVHFPFFTEDKINADERQAGQEGGKKSFDVRIVSQSRQMVWY